MILKGDRNGIDGKISEEAIHLCEFLNQELRGIKKGFFKSQRFNLFHLLRCKLWRWKLKFVEGALLESELSARHRLSAFQNNLDNPIDAF